MDGDVGLSFGKQQQMRLDIYGVGHWYHRGSYRVEPESGRISLEFDDGYRDPAYEGMLLKTESIHGARRLYLKDRWFAEVPVLPGSEAG